MSQVQNGIREEKADITPALLPGARSLIATKFTPWGNAKSISILP